MKNILSIAILLKKLSGNTHLYTIEHKTFQIGTSLHKVVYYTHACMMHGYNLYLKDLKKCVDYTRFTRVWGVGSRLWGVLDICWYIDKRDRATEALAGLKHGRKFAISTSMLFFIYRFPVILGCIYTHTRYVLF